MSSRIICDICDKPIIDLSSAVKFGTVGQMGQVAVEYDFHRHCFTELEKWMGAQKHAS